jgi:Protein of unknown function (DUF1579)
MADNDPKEAVEPQHPRAPKPDPALHGLDRMAGTWRISGRTLDAQEDNVFGRATCEWIPGGYFLQLRTTIEFKGLHAESLEIIAYDPQTKSFPARVYSNMSGAALAYHWDVQGDVVTHWTAAHKYTGKFSADGRTLSGGWRRADGSADVASYDAVMTRTD